MKINRPQEDPARLNHSTNETSLTKPEPKNSNRYRPRRNPKARLALVGTGPDADALKEHFAGTKTVLTGLMTGEALSQAFASADVFVMPSDTETLGFVVLESMASGVPVVGADAGGIPDLIGDGKVCLCVGLAWCLTSARCERGSAVWCGVVVVLTRTSAVRAECVVAGVFVSVGRPSGGVEVAVLCMWYLFFSRFLLSFCFGGLFLVFAVGVCAPLMAQPCGPVLVVLG